MRRISAVLFLRTFAHPNGLLAQAQSGSPYGASSSHATTQMQSVGALRLPALETAASKRSVEFPAFGAQQSKGQGQKSWAARHPALLGALIGAGAGTAAGLGLGLWGSCNTGNPDTPCGPFALALVGVGAGVGSAVGFGISRFQR